MAAPEAASGREEGGAASALAARASGHEAATTSATDDALSSQPEQTLAEWLAAGPFTLALSSSFFVRALPRGPAAARAVRTFERAAFLRAGILRALRRAAGA